MKTKFSILSKTFLMAACLLVAGKAFAISSEKPLTEVSPYYTLTITPETKWVNPKGEVNTVYLSDVSDGAWGCRMNDAWGFYLIDGTKITDYIWDSVNSENPTFSSGAVFLYLNGESYDQRHLRILHTDGSVTELPSKYINPTDFVDGVALVQIKGGMGKYVFLDTNGKEVYPQIKTEPTYTENFKTRIAPCTEGLRAYMDPESRLWGFFDENGNIVIKPQYSQVRSFSEGMALVEDRNREIYFIDRQGNKACAPDWDLSDLRFRYISDFHNGYCVQRDLKDDMSLYFDKSGQEVAYIKHGTPFNDGYAWGCPKEGEKYTRYVKVINDKLQVIEPEMNEISYVDLPKFNDGLGVVNSHDVIREDGKIQISGLLGHPFSYDYYADCRIYSFYSSGYAHAIIKIDGVEYEGFINQKGEFVLIFNWPRREVKEVKTRYLAPEAKYPFTSPADYIDAVLPINITNNSL